MVHIFAYLFMPHIPDNENEEKFSDLIMFIMGICIFVTDSKEEKISLVATYHANSRFIFIGIHLSRLDCSVVTLLQVATIS